MSDNTYNGWVNYETWLLNLWLTNEQVAYNEVNYILRNCSDDYAAGEAIKAYIENGGLGVLPITGFQADVINAALKDVEWIDIARSNREN